MSTTSNAPQTRPTLAAIDRTPGSSGAVQPGADSDSDFDMEVMLLENLGSTPTDDPSNTKTDPQEGRKKGLQVALARRVNLEHAKGVLAGSITRNET